MIVGDTCVGKTKLAIVLQKALTALDGQGEYTDVNTL